MTPSELTLQERLAERLMDVFEGVHDRRRAYFEARPELRPEPEQVTGMIRRYSLMNAACAGGLALAPGPWGLVAVVPEIVVVMRNQVQMVYDIGVAHDNDDVLSRELLLAILLASSGSGAMGMFTQQGRTILVKKPAAKVFGKSVGVLASVVGKRLARSATASWVPMLGAAAVATWTQVTTSRVGHRANDILALDLQMESTYQLEDQQVVAVDPNLVLANKIALFSQLMRVDGEVDSTELGWVRTIIDRSDLPHDDKGRLLVRLSRNALPEPDLTVFADPDDAFALVVDLATLAGRDGVVYDSEREFVLSVAREVGVEDAEAAFG